jgi:hypothetical protein
MNLTLRQAAVKLRDSAAQDATLYEYDGKYGVSAKINLTDVEKIICTWEELQSFGATTEMSDSDYADAVEAYIKQYPPENRDNDEVDCA